MQTNYEPIADRLFYLLKKKVSPASGYASCHREILQRELGVSQPSISRALKELIAEGSVRVLRKANRYNPAKWKLLMAHRPAKTDTYHDEKQSSGASNK